MAKKAAKSKTAKPSPKHPLDALAEGDPLRVIALMLWQDRLREPDMYRKINEQDIAGLEDCVNYLKVSPTVKIYRPQGLPAQPAQPATHNRRAIPGRDATQPKPYVIVTLVDKKTGDVIRPVENNQDDYDKAQAASEVRKARDQAGNLAARLMEQANKGEYSTSDMTDAANALLVLSRET